MASIMVITIVTKSCPSITFNAVEILYLLQSLNFWVGVEVPYHRSVLKTNLNCLSNSFLCVIIYQNIEVFLRNTRYDVVLLVSFKWAFEKIWKFNYSKLLIDWTSFQIFKCKFLAWLILKNVNFFYNQDLIFKVKHHILFCH